MTEDLLTPFFSQCFIKRSKSFVRIANVKVDVVSKLLTN